MAIQKEIWISDIASNLFASNRFMNLVGRDDSAYVDNSVVHIPQAGAKPSVAVNRASVPAAIAQRTDTDLTYNLNEFTTDPLLIKDIESLQVNYNKRMDVLKDHINQLGYAASNKTLYAWAASGATRQVRTSGAASALALSPSATGTRKKMVLDDIAGALSILGQDDVDPSEEKFMIVPSAMYYTDLLRDSSISKYLEFGKAVLPEGVVDRVMGLNILIRSSVVVYDNTGTPVIKSTDNNGTPTGAASDNQGVIVCTKSAVRRAMGSVKVFSNEDQAAYYGSIFSASVMQGASKNRSDQKGIVSIIQAA